ncbi:MAG: hypothetical protein ACXV5I_06300 [Halobacteriota archaeon]
MCDDIILIEPIITAFRAIWVHTATLQAKHGKYGTAANTLKDPLVPCVSGYHNSGQADWNDFVRTCDAQRPL